MKTLFQEFKKRLSQDEEERFEQVKILFNNMKKDIIKNEGSCDEEELAKTIVNGLELEYEMYLALCMIDAI